MNYGGYQNYNSCCQPDACQVRCKFVGYLCWTLQKHVVPSSVPYACCGATIPTLEPLIPVAETRRRSKVPRKSCVASTNRVSGLKNKKAHGKDSLREDCNVQKETSFDETSNVARNGLQHPDDCGCAECYVTDADGACQWRKGVFKFLTKFSFHFR